MSSEELGKRKQHRLMSDQILRV